ncbi:MAG: Zn-ribbon domain-containing OB-fold protein [Nitrospirae bacterium]|nr:Zn-ribbon domain-containing OB-fold protein [Nitrospirota bacterium]
MGDILAEDKKKLDSLLKGGSSGIEPLVFEQSYDIEYVMSHGQDSPFFVGLAFGKLLGTRCKACHYSYATPKSFCVNCGGRCSWVEVPGSGKIHTFTLCHFGSEAFLKETPYLLILVEFEGFNTLFLSRLKGVDPATAGLKLIGTKVEAKFNPALKDKLDFMRKRKIDYKRTESLSSEEKDLIKKMEIKVSDLWFEPA